MTGSGGASSGRARLGVAALLTVVGGCWHAPAPLGPEGRAAWAQELLAPSVPPPGDCPVGPLDETAAIARVARHPELRVADARARASEAAVDTPRERDPELRIGTVRLDELLDGGPRFGVGVRARFERPGTLAARTHEAELVATVARAERDETAGALVRAARLAHARAVAAAALVTLREREEALVATRAERIERAAALGGAARVEGDLATLDLASATEATARARADAADTAGALARAVGAPAGCTVVPAGAVDAWVAPAELPPVEALTTQALSRRAVVAAAAADVERGATRRFVAGRERWPWFDFAQLEYVTGDLDPTRWGLTVGISLPLFRLGDGQVAAADADAWLARARAERDIRALAEEVATARARVVGAGAALRAARAALARYPEERLEALRAAAGAADVDPEAVERVERARLGLERRAIAAALALREAQVTLDAAVASGPP